MNKVWCNFSFVSLLFPPDLHLVMVDVKGKRLGLTAALWLNNLPIVPARCVPWHVPCFSPLLRSSAALTESVKLPLLAVVLTFPFFAFQGKGWCPVWTLCWVMPWAVRTAASLGWCVNMHVDLHRFWCEDNRKCEHAAKGLQAGFSVGEGQCEELRYVLL